MAQISTRKRGNTWEYSFEVAPVNGKRKRKSKGQFMIGLKQKDSFVIILVLLNSIILIELF